MPPYLVFVLILVLTLAALRVGLRLSALLPEHHLASDARDSAKIGIGMLATLLALVLGLMITSAKRAFDEREADLVEISTSIVLLDHALDGFGPDAGPARGQLRAMVDGIMVVRAAPPAHMTTQNLRAITQLQKTILALSPASEAQHWYQARAMQLTSAIAQDRVLSSEHGESSVPAVLIVIVGGWVVLIYLGLGAFLVSNRSVIVALSICALAFACSIYIILELDTPYSGVVSVSEKPLIRAQAALSQR